MPVRKPEEAPSCIEPRTAILLIAKRDYLATIRTKAFIIGLVVAPLLFGGGFLGVALLKSKPDIKDRRIAIVDRTEAWSAAP